MRTFSLTNPPMRGDDLKPLQKALKAGRFYNGQIDGIYGPACGLACKHAKWALGYPAKQCVETGGQTLLDYLDGNVGLPPLYRVRRHRRGFGQTPEDLARARIVAWAMKGVADTAQIHYAQIRPIPHQWRLPMTTDCSGFVTLCYQLAGAPDPNGQRYDGQGYCHEPSARILTADLRWIPAGELAVGDELWAFDDAPNAGRGRLTRRRYHRAKVLASFPSIKQSVRVCLDSGETFICSSDHPWLTYSPGIAKHHWTRAADLLPRQLTARNGTRHLVRPFMPWEPDRSYEAGWLAGIFDGEGWVVNRGARGGRTNGVGITQVLGPTADRIVSLVSRYGSFRTTLIERDGIQPRLDVASNGGGVTQAAAFLGTIRAERLISNFTLEGGELQTRHDARVVAVEDVGLREVQSIQTTTGTYLAEGFAVHNTGTLLSHGVTVPVSQARPADLVIWGANPGHHVAVVVAPGRDPQIVSHGSEAGPIRETISGETQAQQRPYQVRRYPL